MTARLIFNKLTRRKMSQEQLADFIRDKKTIDKAARGSMKKRNELLKRVELKQKHA